jgi:NADH dehydrogenase
VEWAWDYFGGGRGDSVLDHSEELETNWNEDAEEMASAASVGSSQHP